MDRNLIIESLKHCAGTDGCATCPQREGGKRCEMNLRVTLDLLTELIEENERLTPEKPIEEADDFGDRSVCCPHCLGPVTNYWAPGTTPKHCQFCGQALDWDKEAEADG